MKKLVFYFAILLLGVTYMQAETGSERMMSYYNYGNSFIFVENGITFSVYPDGEFDFYINNRVNVGANVSVGYSNITFNSGFNYNPFVQYDDYGAVIQVENVPVYYDFYGRVSQIGGVNIWYRNNRVRRIGGLRVFYNNLGYYDYCTGYINVYNRYYVYRPWHRYFIRPAVGYCQVFTSPYRRYYYPVRYTYYAPYRYNHRRVYATAGRPYRHYDRGYKRSKIYRNDRRVAVRDNGRRNEYGHVRYADRSNRTIADNRSRTVTRSTDTRVSEGSRSNVTRTRTRMARNSDDGNRRVTRTVATRERSIEQSNARRAKPKSTVRSTRNTAETKRKEVATRGHSVTRATTNKRSSSINKRTSSAKPERSRTYSRNIKSSDKVSSRPNNRTSRSSSVARSKSDKKTASSSTRNRSSSSRSKGTVKRSNTRRVK